METIKIIEGINEAIKTLDKASKANASGSVTIWRMTYHAQTHLDKQIAELLAPEPSPVILGSCADNHAHPGHQHNYIDGVCILRGCKATQANDPLCKAERAAENRTRTGNTPTCEDCDQPQDRCTCGDHEPGCTCRHCEPEPVDAEERYIHED